MLACHFTAAAGDLVLTGPLTISVPAEHEAVERAASDLARDAGWCLGIPGILVSDPAAEATARVRLDPAIGGPEQYAVAIGPDGINVSNIREHTMAVQAAMEMMADLNAGTLNVDER